MIAAAGHRRAQLGRRLHAAGSRDRPAAGVRRRHRKRIRHVPDAVRAVPRQPERRPRADAERAARDDAGENLRGADDRADAAAGVGAQRRTEESASPSSWPAGRSAARSRAAPRTWASSAARIRRSPIRRAGPSWNGWSPDLANTRFQPAQVARLTAAQVPRLKLKWAFGFPSGVSANAQPTVASGRVFVGSDNGYVYSIDAKTGCVYWSFETGSIIRNAITVGAVKGNGDAKYAAFVGDGHANVFAINAQDGKLLWKTKVDPHFVARITAGIRYYDGKVIVPVSSSEEFSSGNPGYSCCTSRGSVVALDAEHRQADLEGLGHPRRAEAVQDDGERRDAVCAGRRRGLELADDRSGEARGVLRHRRRDDGAVAEDDGRDHGGRSRHRESSSGRIRRPRTTSSWAAATAPNVSEACPKPMGPDMDIGNSPILQDAAERQARADRRHEVGGHLRARSGRQRQAALPRFIRSACR